MNEKGRLRNKYFWKADANLKAWLLRMHGCHLAFFKLFARKIIWPFFENERK